MKGLSRAFFFGFEGPVVVGWGGGVSVLQSSRIAEWMTLCFRRYGIVSLVLLPMWLVTSKFLVLAPKNLLVLSIRVSSRGLYPAS